MLVFWKEKLVLLSVPKTGTTAIEAALKSKASMIISDPPELKHAPVYRYNRFFRPMFEKACKAEMETFAMMREPISWLGSWFKYRQRPFLDGQPKSTAGMSFDDFVLAYMKGDKPPFANVGSQVRFLEPRPNGTKVDHLFRYEDNAGWSRFLKQRLDTDVEFDRLNVSSTEKLILSPNVEDRFRRKMSDEFDLWNNIPIRAQ
ncbi:gamma-glutamyl kinase [Planktotalea arctica]|uniref:gamma-glutamyl kinase n=1 Tax=Planktotalea arctica TaxID=1481893 RepID=UPI000A174D9A|nr:gamma-glutamyl kinase [Planktotalea arctica]